MPLNVGPDLYRLLVDSVRDYAIFALDAQGNVLTWNAGAERFKGYKAHEIIGQHFSRFYSDEDRAERKPERELEIATEHGRVEDEGWRIRKDGSRFWANVVITALRENGTLVGFAKVTRDLSDRRAAAEVLRQSEQRFRLLVHSVRDYGIFMLDPTGHVVSWNEGAERMNGYAAHEILGQHFSKFYPAEDLAWDKPGMEIEVATRDGRFEDEGWRVRKDGSRFWANVVITAIREPNTGNLVGFTKVTRDLSERRAAELQALEDARRIALAQAANKAKSEFLASMSHELRTPLNAIGGYADLLLAGVTGGLTPTQCEYIERVRRSQQHLLSIINDLLNFSRMEAGRVTYDIAPVKLNEAMSRVVTMVEAQAMQRGLELDADVDTDVLVLADRPKVEQILLNLLSNAMKFTEPGGQITVQPFATEEFGGVRVIDTGVGIPADKLESIFEPFVQVGRTFTTPHEGVGLGLAISRDLARAMGGELTARSIPHVGSSFELTLPRS